MEYAVVITCIVAALLAMQIYIKRGMEGRLRQSADELGQQYAPKRTTGTTNLTYTSNIRTTVESKSEFDLQRDLDGDGILEKDVFGTETKSQLVGDNNQTQDSSEHVGAMESSLYGE